MQCLAEPSFPHGGRHSGAVRFNELVSSTIDSEDPGKSKAATAERKEEDATEKKLAVEVNKVEELAVMGLAAPQEKQQSERGPKHRILVGEGLVTAGGSLQLP